MTIGERINKERKQLGFSQAAFAALGGASKGSQIAWEKGSAFPNAAVLAAWAKVGVDVTYVLTGERTKEQALWSVLNSIQGFLQLIAHDEELREACLLANDEIEASKRGEDVGNKAELAIFALLKKSPALLLDQALFEDMLEKLEFVLDAKELTLSSSSKAKAVMHLYRAVQAAGRRIDLDMVESAIKSVSP
ncbi:MAG: helix-turn-helix transcriptional regulator [Gallionella sp.]|nr:helix-turn-helix transcriptional regulator [Gallionella sp.]